MPEREWTVWLGEACRIEADRITREGKVIGFRVILLADIDGETHCVTRFDTAHGFAHQDILAFGGRPIEKRIMEEEDFSLAFESAYLDLIANHERYLRTYRNA